MNNSELVLLKESAVLSQHKAYLFDEYNYLFSEREKRKPAIIQALNKNTQPFEVKNWFRLVNTLSITHPLNCKGSVDNHPGGRFNIGQIRNGYFASFPALYIGNGKEICIKEVYDGMEQFFNTKKGDCFVCINGYIHSVLDLTKKHSLNSFIKIIKQFTLSDALQKRAKKINLTRNLVYNVTQLKKTMFNRDWRRDPNIHDIPAPSQIFGQLAHQAGIEAILYKSTRKSRRGGLCLAVFPKNFKNSNSVLAVENYSIKTKYKKIDSESYQSFY